LLAGGSPLSALLHVARTVARRPSVGLAAL